MPLKRKKLCSWSLVSLIGISLITPLVLADSAVIVSQRKREFFPGHLMIKKGVLVRIKNDDNVTHHIFVNAPNMKFDSGEQPVGKTVEIRFTERGTFTARCAIHPIMRLEVTVE